MFGEKEGPTPEEMGAGKKKETVNGIEIQLTRVGDEYELYFPGLEI
jgi:hypothetical protein